MNLQDYAPYYIGCPCLNTWFPADHSCYNSGWKLQGFQVTSVKPCLLESDTDYTWSDSVKLVLRRVEDMTEEEAIEVHREATKTPFLPADKDEYDVTYVKSKAEICSIQVVDLRMPKMHTNINIEGDVLVYIHEHNEEPKICERVANQHHITHYLLTHHFDLFGLIDAELAVDAKALKEHTADNSDDNEPPMCHWCHGTGENTSGTSYCRDCKGTGVQGKNRR